jgi:Glycosyl transferases group 1
VVPNPIRVEDWPFHEHKDDYLLWMGRMDPVKGARSQPRAWQASGSCSRGRCNPGRRTTSAARSRCTSTATWCGSSARWAARAERELFARAKAFVMPIRWAEPFGMVMVEALACGTPVIAFSEGAASEIVIDGQNGVLVADEQAMADAIGWLGAIDPLGCRESVASRYDIGIVADGYETVYRRAAGLRELPALPRREEREELLVSPADEIAKSAARGGSEGGGVGLRGLAELPALVALERLDGAGDIDVDQRVELAGGACREVVALALGRRAVDDADRALEARLAQRTATVARGQWAEQEGGDARGVK